MKKIIFTLFAFCIVYLNTNAQYCGSSNPSAPSQCTPSGLLTKPGLEPTSDSLPPVVNGVVSTTIIQFKNYDTTRYQGNLVTVSKLRIDSINNLPSGLCWATNVANNTYTNQQDGCIRIIGTACSNPGVYKLVIKVGVDVGLGVFIPVDAGSVGLKYYVRVKNSGDATVALDTSQTAAFSKPTGYSASATGCTVGFTDLASIKTSLNIVPNPFNNDAQVTFFSEKESLMTETITNMIGSEVYRKEMEVRVGENITTIDRNNLPTGVYFYSLSDGKFLVTKRIMIE